MLYLTTCGASLVFSSETVNQSSMKKLQFHVLLSSLLHILKQNEDQYETGKQMLNNCALFDSQRYKPKHMRFSLEVPTSSEKLQLTSASVSEH